MVVTRVPVPAVQPEFLAGGGEMGARMRTFDWPRTSLGSSSAWPQALKTAVSICLNSRFPIIIFAGPEHVVLYNDDYAPILGNKHPWALGRPGRIVWAEIWDVIGPMLEGVRATGKATWSDDLLLVIDRHGYLEETYFTFSYTPVLEGNEVVGSFTAVSFTTERKIGERRLETLRALAAQTTDAKTAEEVCTAAADALSGNGADVPFALLYLTDAERRCAVLAGAAGIARGTALSPERIELAGNTAAAPWPLGRVMRAGRVERVNCTGLGPLPGGPWGVPPGEALVLPVLLPGGEAPAAFVVAGVSPRKALDGVYRHFFDSLAGHVATALANARAYEEERRRAEALAEIDRAKTIFFSNISHEFRTPLTLMLGPVEDMLADQGPEQGPERDERENLTVIHRNGLRLLKLVNTLLDFSRIEAGRIQALYRPTDLAALTTDLAGVFRSAVERAGLTLTVECPPLPEPVHVDRDMWEKIVLNLVSNAFKFTLEGGITVTLRPAGAMAELTVRDTGTGIPAAELPRIFERFHRVEGARGRTHEGTGIGLALVRELVHLHGGTVRADSAPDQGSIFTVAIPLGTSHLPAGRIGEAGTAGSMQWRSDMFVEEALSWLPRDEAAERPAEPVGSRPRIVLADDNADMRDYVRRLLDPFYEVEAVADGAAALAAIRRKPPDLVLTDVMMPGLDGFELLRAIRGEPQISALPVVMLSARAGEEARVDGLHAGADDYLVKPFSARELLARVRSTLDVAAIRHKAVQDELDYAERLRKLASASLTITMADTLDGTMQTITDAARDVIGAHQAVASLTTGEDRAQAITTVSLSEKYRRWHDYLEAPDGSGIYAWVCRTNRPIRMTQSELEADPRWRGFGAAAAHHPPMRGWLAVPLVGRNGVNLGLIQLSDKEEGEFTETDEAVLIQFAQLAAAAIEKARSEAALRESEERFRVAVMNSPIIVYTCDDALRYTWIANAHPAFDAVTILGRRDDELLPADDVADLMAFKRGVLESGSGGRQEIGIRIGGAVQYYDITAEPLRDGAGRIAGLTVAALEITERKRAEQHQNLLMAELSHRVKNTLATVISIASYTMQDAPSLEAFRRSFEGRIHALAHNHSLLARTNWQGADLDEVVRAELTPYRSECPTAARIEGPALCLKPRAVLALGLVMHELATNAAKYGALSVPAGRVEVRWHVEDREDGGVLVIDWRESGGPPVVPPTRRGFGRLLIERGLAHDISGTARMDFRPEGLHCRLEIPAEEAVTV